MSSHLFPVFKSSRVNAQPENMRDIIFENTKGIYAEATSKGFFKKGVMRHLVEFTRKHVPEPLFLIKLNSVDLQLL